MGREKILGENLYQNVEIHSINEIKKTPQNQTNAPSHENCDILKNHIHASYLLFDIFLNVQEALKRKSGYWETESINTWSNI